MFEIKKRGKGKVKRHYGIRDMYKAYKKECKQDKIEPKPYSLFKEIICSGNKEMSRIMVEDAGEVIFPYRLGSQRIRKYDRKFNLKTKEKWSVDWKESKKLGFVVYHEQPFLYKWFWDKSTCIVKWKSAYKFKACRTNTRAVNKTVKATGIDYFK